MDHSSINDVSAFAKQVGSQFRIEIDPEQTVAAELVEATALNSGGENAEESARKPFSLMLAVEGGINLPQQTYRVSHDALGDTLLFLVPLGDGRSESVFN